ncbi:MAG: VOC family protein [Thermoanaerobaculia bacterium]
MDNQPFLGLRTAVYHVEDIEKARDWYRTVLDTDPYFDQPFYVGFNVGGFELGLDPDPDSGRPGAGSVGAYWGVKDAEAAYARLLGLGASEHQGVRDVGEGIRVASVLDPFGNVLGIIENPHFRIEGPGPVPVS